MLWSMIAAREPRLIAPLGANLLLFFVAVLPLVADQIEMQSGDRYVGRVLALTNDVLVIQSDLLGTVRLPRNKVASINLGPASSTARAPARPDHPSLATPSPTNASGNALSRRLPASPAPQGEGQPNPDLSAALRQLSAGTNSIQQIQRQLLGDASPDANKKYNEMVGGLLDGKLNLSDIRAEAASAANQLRALKKELGNEAFSALEGYLSILDTFLRETTAQSGGQSGEGGDARTKPRTPPDEE